MIDFILFATILLFSSNLSNAISPAKDARTYFSGDFYRRAIYDLGKTKDDIVVSPAAAQKFLVAFYKGMQQREADLLLFDIGVKHIDMERLLEETYEETGTYDTGFSMHLRQKQLRELAPFINKSEVITYFKKDFEGTSNFINVENYIVVPENFNPKPDYQKFSKEYFNVDLVNAKTDVVTNLQTKFDVKEADSNKVQLFSNVELKVRVVNSGASSADKNIVFDGKAKYFEDDISQHIELDLENGLKLFMFTATNASDFNYYITQAIGRTISDFDDYYDEKWSMEKVMVTIPAINFENVNDLAVTLRAKSNRGLKDALTTDAKLSEAFENWPENGPNIEHFWQRVSLKIETSAARLVTFGFSNQIIKVFNAVGKSFFYAIKDDTSYYAMGSHINKETDD